MNINCIFSYDYHKLLHCLICCRWSKNIRERQSDILIWKTIFKNLSIQCKSSLRVSSYEYFSVNIKINVLIVFVHFEELKYIFYFNTRKMIPWYSPHVYLSSTHWKYNFESEISVNFIVVCITYTYIHLWYKDSRVQRNIS